MGEVPSTHTVEEERELFLRLKANPELIGELYDRYAKPIYAFCLKRCGHKETAEDLVSHTFTKLLEHIDSLEWRGVSIKCWLFQVASNALIDHYRKASTRKDTELDEDVWEPPSSDDPAWNTELVIEGEFMRDMLQTLNDRDQRILDLRFFAGLEPQEIAVTLDISPNHVSVLIYRALGRLRKQLIATRGVDATATS